VLTVVRIHTAVRVGTSYRLGLVYEYFGAAFCVYLHRPGKDGGSMLRWKTPLRIAQITWSHNPEDYNLEIFLEFLLHKKLGSLGYVALDATVPMSCYIVRKLPPEDTRGPQTRMPVS
jgi:hypothetical protein